MHGTLPRSIENAREIERNILRGTARICRHPFGAAWKGIFQQKAAEELAARIGCSVRAAAYQLSGESEPSARAIRALVDLCAPNFE